MQDRLYQSETIAAVEAGFGQFRRQLIVIPTGGGKTIIFAKLAKRRLPQRTLILAHREELIDQAIAKLRAATGIQADKEKAEHSASLSAPVVVASVQSLMGERRLSRWPKNHFGLLVCDEAHHAVSDSWQKVLSYFDSQVLGVTATPDRSDKRDLGAFFENIAAEVSLFDLVNQGFLSPITLKSVPLSVDLSKVRRIAGDFSDADLGDALEPYLGQIAELIAEHASFRRILAFLPLISTSLKFTDACRAAGLSAAHIDGNSPDRQEILDRFAAGEWDLLSNAMLLTEGYDGPFIDCVCILRPTSSRGLYSQMVGRGTRTHPSKSNLLLLDFLWLHEKHAIVRPAHLIAKSDEEAESIARVAADKKASGEQGELDLQGLASIAAAQREATLAAKLKQNKAKKAKTLSAAEFALEHNSMDVAEYEPSMQWESGTVTEKQAKLLKRAHIDLKSVRGRGHASKLIDLYFRGQKLVLASPGQREFLRRTGHTHPDTATAQEARQWFGRVRGQA